MSPLFRPGEHGIYVIAQNVEAFRDDGMFVLNEKLGVFAFFFAHLRQFGNDRLPVCSGEVMLVVDLIVQHGRSHEGQDTEQGSARRSSGDVFNGFRRDREVGAMGGFQYPGIGFRYRHGQGVFLFLAQQHQVQFFLNLVFTDKRNDFLFLDGSFRQAFSQGIPFVNKLVEFEIQIAAVVGESFVSRRSGGIHPLPQAHGNRVLGAGASSDFLIFQISLVVMFYLPGDAGIGKTGFYGDQPLLAFAFLEIVSKGGRQFDLSFKIKDFLFQRLGGAEVRAHGCVRIFDDVTLRFKFGKFFVHVAQGGSKFF